MQINETPLYEEIFNSVMEGSSTLRHSSSDSGKIRVLSFLKSWQDSMGLYEFILDPKLSAGYTRVMAAVLDTNPRSERMKSKIKHVHILAVNETTGFVDLLNVQKKRKDLEGFLSPEGMEAVLSDNAQDPFPVCYASDNKHIPIKSRMESLSEFCELLNRKVARSSNIILNSKMFLKRANGVASTIPGGARIRKKAHSEAERIFQCRLNQCIMNIMPYIDPGVIKWAESVNQEDIVIKKYGSIATFNKIMGFDGQTEREYAYAAYLQYSKLGILYWDEPIWDDIIEGQSPIKVLSKDLGVKPATIKHLCKRSAVFCMGKNTRRYAVFLDALDLAFWPNSKEELAFFRDVVEVAKIYSEGFSRNPYEVVKDWVKQNKSLKTWDGDYAWSALFGVILKKQLKNVSEEGTTVTAEFMEAYNPKDVYSDSVQRSAINQYKRDIFDIKDMKADIHKKLIMPQVFLSLEAAGLIVQDTSIVTGIADTVSLVLWSGMLPSDQISSSAYWHSPRVNVSRRFNSAVQGEDPKYNKWEPLFEDEFWESKNGVRFHSLFSTKALEAEGDAMIHCVGSYSHNCMMHNYHILSLRDEHGERLSTLTVKDFLKDGKRYVQKYTK